MKKLQILKAARIAHLVIWSVLALVVIISVCKVWSANGCGISSLAAGFLFYGCTCAGICISGHLQFNEKIKETEEALKAQQQPQQPEPLKRIRKQVF